MKVFPFLGRLDVSKRLRLDHIPFTISTDGTR